MADVIGGIVSTIVAHRWVTVRADHVTSVSVYASRMAMGGQPGNENHRQAGIQLATAGCLHIMTASSEGQRGEQPRL